MSEGMIIAQFAIQYGLHAAVQLVALLRKGEPTTVAEWKELAEMGKTYEQYMEDAKNKPKPA